MINVLTLILEAGTPITASSLINDTEGTRVADAIGFPDVGSLFAFGALNASTNISETILSGLPGWAASEAQAGGGISAEALQQIMTVQAKNILNDRGQPGTES